jgi:ankyrin repeat protein
MNETIIQFLAKYNYDFVKDKKMYFLWACEQGHLDMVEYLTSQEIGCDPEADHNYAIQFAALNGHLEVVKYLFSIGGDPKSHNNYAIRLASKNGHLKVVKYLVDLGCDPKACNNHAIQFASLNNHLDVVKYLVEMDCDHKNISFDIKYKVLCECKNKLAMFMQTVKANKYLKMEILKMLFPEFTEFQIMKTL